VVRTGRAKFAGPRLDVRIEEPEYRVVSTVDMDVAGHAGLDRSFTTHVDAKRALDGHDAGTGLQVVGAHALPGEQAGLR
jgi:hypothetical protein